MVFFFILLHISILHFFSHISPLCYGFDFFPLFTYNNPNNYYQLNVFRTCNEVWDDTITDNFIITFVNEQKIHFPPDHHSFLLKLAEIFSPLCFMLIVKKTLLKEYFQRLFHWVFQIGADNNNINQSNICIYSSRTSLIFSNTSLSTVSCSSVFSRESL